MDTKTWSWPLARIPWVLVDFDDMKLEDSFLFKLEECEYIEKRIDQLKSFRYFNKAFPFYIPIEHHKMSVKGIMESSPNGQYWAVAIYFLISTLGHGSEQWSKFQKQIRHELFSCHLYISQNTVFKLFPDGIPQCKKDVDFFFEPSILIQLPHQTDLFHQWLVAALKETLQFQYEMTYFYYNKFPKQFKKEVEKFQKTLNKMQGFILNGFRFLQEKCDPSTSSDSKITISLEPALSFLHFWLKLDGEAVIASLRAQCYAVTKNCSEKERGAVQLTNFKKENLERDKFFTSKLGIYTPSSWQRVDVEQEIFVCHKAIPTPVKNDDDFPLCVKKEETGVLVSILQQILYLVSLENLQTQDSESITCFRVKCMSHQEIKRKIEKLDQFEPSSLKIKEDYGTNVNRARPKSTDEPMVIAEHFENRIKRVKIKMCKNSQKGVCFVQYMLPCFVASFLEMSTEKCFSHSDTTKRYIEFLHKLVSAYEDNATAEEWPETKVDENLALLLKINHQSHALLLSYYRRVVFMLLSAVSADSVLKRFVRAELFPSFYEALEYGNAWHYPQYSPEADVSPWVNDRYILQTYDFFSKVEIALDYTFPKQITHEKLWAQDMADLIRTLCLFGVEMKDDKSLVYISFTSYSKLLYDILKICETLENPPLVKEQISSLPQEQKLSIAFYLTLNIVSRTKMMKILKLNDTSLSNMNFTSSDLGVAFHSYLKGGNMWELKKFYSMKLGFKAASSLAFVNDSALDCYSSAFHFYENNKHEDKSLDLNWAFPVKSCRRCFSYDSPDNFRLCSKCKNCVEYPDKNYFCSENCEALALSTRHEKEHCEFDDYNQN